MNMSKRIPLLLTFAILVLFLTTCSPSSSTPPPATNISPTASAQNTDGAMTTYIPGGTYVIGSDTTDTAAQPQEMPLHKITLTGFNIYTAEVTNAMYQACVAAGACLSVTGLRSDLAGYYNNAAFAKYPVIGVDWNMADAYCQWVNGRLPTEAEWEVATRGPDERIYPWGSDPASCDLAGMSGCGQELVPFQIGSFAKGNGPFGTWDMSGNVWEWVNDWYDANYYAVSPDNDPVGPWAGNLKVVRGGGWNSIAERLRSAGRYGIDPSLSYKDMGFRCVVNGLPIGNAISSTDGTHSVTDGGSASVDDELTTPTDATVHRWTWGTPVTSCAAGRTGIFTVAAWNNLSGNYTATVDGAPVACVYDDASRTLTCHWPLSTPASAGYYEASITLHDASGSAVTGGTYTFRINSSSFSDCTGTTGSDVNLFAGAYCGSDGTPYLSVVANIAMHFTSLTGDVTVADLAHNCTNPSLNMLVCPLGTSLMGSTVSGQVDGTTTDGVVPIHGTFSSVSIPTCTSSSGGEMPTVRACADNPSVTGWQNPTNRYDVNNDGCVTPLDVLLLINTINTVSSSGGSTRLALPRPVGSAFVDVNGDGSITAVDVLQTISYLNAHTGEACTSTCSSAIISDNIHPESVCNGSHVMLRVTTDLSIGLEPLTLNGTSFSPVDCVGRGTTAVTCMISDALMGSTASVVVAGRNTYGTVMPFTYSINIPTCGNGAEQPGGPTSTTAPVTPTFTPVPSCSGYTNANTCGSAGCYWWYSDNTCNTKPEIIPPTWTPVPACSSYTDPATCTKFSCYWWSASCHIDQDPCHKYDGNQQGCENVGCSYDTKNLTCNTP
jgi:formylglycine-generating enzyme